MLKLNRRTATNELHRDLSLLKVSDINTVSVLCFVAQRPVSISKFGKQNANFVATITLMFPGVEPKQVLAHVTFKEIVEWKFCDCQSLFI